MPGEDLYEPIGFDNQSPPPPPPTDAPPKPPPPPPPPAADKKSNEKGQFFEKNKADGTTMSGVTDSAFGDAAQSAYTYQPETGTERKDGYGSKSEDGKRTKGAFITMIVSGIVFLLSTFLAIGGGLGLWLDKEPDPKDIQI